MIQLIQQKDLENSMEKVSVAASDIEEKVWPLYKKLNMFKSLEEKEKLKKKIETTEKDLEKAKKTTLTEILKAYELFRIHFIGKERTQWDKVVQEMHQKDPWVAVNGSLNKGPREKTWEFFLTASNSTSSQSSLVTPLSCSGTTCSSMSGSPDVLQCEPS
jgi:hypothetical protein